MKCQVFNCRSCNKSKASTCSFYCFPTNEELSKKWIEFCRRKEPFNPKTSFICMKHFREDDYQNLRQFNMGLARRRLLKRDAVPSIYDGETNMSIHYKDEISTEESRLQDEFPVEFLARKRLLKRDAVPSIYHGETNMSIHYNDEISTEESRLQDEFSVEYLLDQYNDDPLNESSCDYMNKEDSNIDISTSNTSFCNEDSPQEVEILKTEVSYYYDNSQLQVEDLETEIETLKRENVLLKKENKKQRSEIFGLKREYGIKQRKHAWEVETLRKRLDSKTNEVKNIEKKLSSMFTAGQIEILKSGSKRHIWSKKDIAHATMLYATSPKAYKLMYEQNFPLPNISTLRHRTKGRGTYEEESSD